MSLSLIGLSIVAGLLMLVVIVFSLQQPQNHIVLSQKLDSDLGYEESFKFYLTLYNKYYANDDEYEFRKEVYYSNILYYNALRKMNQIDSMGKGFSIFEDLSLVEFQRMLGGV